MSFGYGTIYMEEGVVFPISYKIGDLIIDEMQARLPKESQQVVVKGEPFSLGVVISTKKSKTELSIQGPSISKKYKMVDYTLWIPYEKVIKSKNIPNAYLDCVCEGIILVFKEYQYDSSIVTKIFSDIKKEVLNNPEYEYRKEDDPSPW
ncbi:MAG TPA: hypothetical protein VIU12_31460 [Chryseolinea sp.]